MAAIFTLGLLIYYWIVLRRYSKNGSTLATLLWSLYVALGLSGIFIALTGGIEPIFEPNYPAVLFLLVSVIITISGFLPFRSQNIALIFGEIRGQKFIENVLIFSQLCATAYFLPFAISSLTGDANENRLFLSEKMEIMGSFGLLNTLAGVASQLFSSSLVLAFVRLAPKSNKSRNIFRAMLLVFSSFSFVVYILAYVGRDGVVYWLMTATMIFLIFRNHLDPLDRNKITLVGLLGALIMLIPFGMITVSRFFDADQGAGWSFFEYFGAQILNFSDYSSIDRPVTYGLQSFPMFFNGGCAVLGLNCQSWVDMKDIVFQQYLNQGKAPWLFGTFVSDFVGDFGNLGALALMSAFSVVCARVCSTRISKIGFSFAKLLLILFLYNIPFWGVFYFRFSISNSYIVVNMLFIFFVSLLQQLISALSISHSLADR